MSEKPNKIQLELEEDYEANRPDPFFKLFTRLQAEQLGLIAKESELQYSTRADLILSVPAGLSVENTLFDFFRRVNVVEFKSENDKFRLRQYVHNQLRIDLEFLQSDAETFDDFLNVIVCSRRPRTFLKVARQRKIRFKPDKGKPWLLSAAVGFQNVVIVICAELPIEEPYFNWLLFAPADSTRWREFVQKLLAEGETKLADAARRMHPKEYIMQYDKFLEEAEAKGLIPPDKLTKYDIQGMKRTVKFWQNMAERYGAEEVARIIVPEFDDDVLVQGLSPERRKALLQKLLAEQEQAEASDPENSSENNK